MNIRSQITTTVKEIVSDIYDTTLDSVEIQYTRKEFDGEYTVVVFPMLRQIKGNPVQIGEAIGKSLVEKVDEIATFNVVKGFLNLVLTDSYFIQAMTSIAEQPTFGYVSQQGEDAVLVEYSSPNTNKPLHLGHVRNNLLGYSIANILKASGKKVYKTQIINDRGIHICKSMVAWLKENEGKPVSEQDTPEITGKKGDHLVGEYYVKFDQAYKIEIQELINEGKTKEVAEKEALILQEAQEMLRKWEAGDPETVALWKKMNSWVYKGFEETYQTMGVDFDSYYFESDTYLLGKDIISEGLEKEVFIKKGDGSVWCDLTNEGLDEKLVLRSDGTSVYMTQDLGTAVQRVKDNPDVGGMIYTVGNEQDYHFKVLFSILKKLGYTWSQNLFHLSYGMVDLPSGKMKSREGTVVDADELMQEMVTTAKKISSELGKLEGYTEEEKNSVYKTIGLGALKYYILKVDPKKRILFNPEESVDFQGNTGPFIQYTYARIQAILRKAKEDGQDIYQVPTIELQDKERELLKLVLQFPEIIQQAAQDLSPAQIANYTYDLVKSYNSFFQNISIFGAQNEAQTQFRVTLSSIVGNTIKNSLELLGIAVPERM
ncbi:arginine--tRNA ligase [Aquimarina sp. ERC-38]|uniref:arginine--tRNA ligase n=1 Tax=Aquimarina sp. ERC-38 TaxID=2949996 RepID=UPI002247444B|nr:arginine--tRNA ligase [Aquimarina sp. ERC-38]UZO79229.1 arginine--tRNA ligase [Aquimarina sp. ERC-38]